MEKPQKVYIGTTSDKGIAEYIFQNGKLIRKKWTNDEKGCTCLAKKEPYIYSVIELGKEEPQEGGYIVAYKIEENGLKKIDKKPSNGKGPCHIAVGEGLDGKITISHYTDGTFCVHSQNEDGTIGKEIFLEKQEGSKLHYSQFQGDYLFKIDLGKDAIVAYRFQNQNIQKISEYYLEKGSQPRHFVIQEEQISILTEKSCEIYELQWKEDKFFFQKKQAMLPKEYKKEETDTGCAIKLSRDKKNLYTTIRGKNLVCVFRKKENGWENIQTISSGGKMPWDLALDNQDEFALVANVDSSRITIFKRNPDDGTLSYFGEENVDLPTYILF